MPGKVLIVLLCSLPCFGRDIVADWYPTLSNRGEGIYFFMRVNGQFVVPQLTVEATADGVVLPKTVGVPDDRTGFFKTKINNLNTFQLIRLTVEFGTYRWVIDKPMRHLILEGSAMVSENNKGEPSLTPGLPECSDSPTREASGP